MNSAPLPLGQQIFVLLFGPPIMAAMWYVLGSGWSYIVQAGNPTPRTKAWAKKGFWILLIVMYGIGAILAVYAWTR